MKELLSSWCIKFEAIDTEIYPEAMKDLQALGIPRVPAVAIDHKMVHGWNPKALAEILGMPYDEPERLPVEKLIQRLDAFLKITQSILQPLTIEQLSLKTPGRDRTLRQLGYHIFRVALTYRNTIDQGYLKEEWFEEKPPAELQNGIDLYSYGQTVREELAGWFELQDSNDDHEVNTYYGKHKTIHEFLERTVWHVAQHLRQIYSLLENVGVTPAISALETDFSFLPLPQNIW